MPGKTRDTSKTCQPKLSLFPWADQWEQSKKGTNFPHVCMCLGRLQTPLSCPHPLSGDPGRTSSKVSLAVCPCVQPDTHGLTTLAGAKQAGHRITFSLFRVKVGFPSQRAVILPWGGGRIIIFCFENNLMIAASWSAFLSVRCNENAVRVMAMKMQETVRDLWVGKIPWRRPWQPTQYSCLENPMDRGAWRAVIHRVTKSQTQLKWLSMHKALGRKDKQPRG